MGSVQDVKLKSECKVLRTAVKNMLMISKEEEEKFISAMNVRVANRVLLRKRMTLFHY